MITVHIRKQGGAAIITIPSNILKMLDVEIGATLEIDVTNREFIARPIRNSTAKRYSLNELLQGLSSKDVKLLNNNTKWARDGKTIGRELA